MLAENMQFLGSILESISFCAMHDLPLRGKSLEEGVFRYLIQLKIDAGGTL